MILLALAFIVGADVQGQAQVVTPTPSLPTAQMLQTQMGPMSMALAGHHEINVNVMTQDTFVVVKDVGDSQIVMVYKIDPHGKVQLLHRARFYY